MIPRRMAALLLLFGGLVLLASAAPSAWRDTITPADPLAPFDRFEEEVALSFAQNRVNLSAPGSERQGALADLRALIASLGTERDAEARALENRYGAALLTPGQFNGALAAVREGKQRLAEVETDLAVRFPPVGPK